MLVFTLQLTHLPNVALSAHGGRAPGTGSHLMQGLLGVPAHVGSESCVP